MGTANAANGSPRQYYLHWMLVVRVSRSGAVHRFRKTSCLRLLGQDSCGTGFIVNNTRGTACCTRKT